MSKKFKIPRHYKFCTISANHLLNPNLSFGAKGLQSWLLMDNSNWDNSLEAISEQTNSTTEEIVMYLNELKANGYLEDIGDSFQVMEIPRKKIKDVTQFTSDDIKQKEDIQNDEIKKERLNLFQKCEIEIDNYTQDPNLARVLLDYLSLRLNPAKGSRLENFKISHINQWKGLLKTLDSMVGSKVKIVQQSINNSWAKFVDIEDSSDNAHSEGYTQEELDEIEKRAELLRKKGAKVVF